MIRFVLAIVALLCVTLVVPLAFSALPRWWRGEVNTDVIPDPPFVHGEIGRRAWFRATPAVILVGGPSFVVASWCFMLLTSPGPLQFVNNEAVRNWLVWGMMAGIFGVLASLFLGASVFIFSWPKQVIPPCHRDEAGALREWDDRRKREGRKA